MSREEKDMSGVLFINDRKESDKHPDWSGKGLVNGRPVWISGWKKEGAKGKFISLAFKDREQKKPDRRHPESRHEADEDVPW